MGRARPEAGEEGPAGGARLWSYSRAAYRIEGELLDLRVGNDAKPLALKVTDRARHGQTYPAVRPYARRPAAPAEAWATEGGRGGAVHWSRVLAGAMPLVWRARGMHWSGGLHGRGRCAVRARARSGGQRTGPTARRRRPPPRSAHAPWASLACDPQRGRSPQSCRSCGCTSRFGGGWGGMRRGLKIDA